MRRMALTIGILAAAACGPADTETADETVVQDAAEQPGEEIAAASPVGLFGVDTLEAGGAYLTDAGGRALYTLEGEDDPGACVDACAEAWPPYTRTAADDLAPSLRNVGLQADLLGSVDREDGSSQVTYGGHPLYFYARDTEPGQTTGQDVTDEWGEWYLVQPSGELQEGEGGGE